MKRNRLLLLGTVLTFSIGTGLAAFSAAPYPSPKSVGPKDAPKPLREEDIRFFETKIRPLLHDRCVSCHGETQPAKGLRLDSRAALLKGGERGPALTPGAPDVSLLLKVVRHEGPLKMPPSGKLADAEIAALTEWVRRGAFWPERSGQGAASLGPLAQNPAANLPKSSHWSFHPPKLPAVPKVQNAAWVKNPIDAFVLAKLEAKGLLPAPPADKRTLIRRATFDLTGLPPTPAEVEAFVNDSAPDAFAKVVDRLLDSPRYGERWGRHWLDVVRYADSLDTRGFGGPGDIADAWRYRDWVVDAFNRDMPYNEFVMNQIAGDLLPAANGKTNIPGIIATGMLAIGNWGNGDADKEKILTDIVDDQIDVVSRGFMGLTVACARCHDHKFDPITAQDYYGLAGIFFSTHILAKLTPKGVGEEPMRIPLASPEELERIRQYEAQTAALENRRKTTAETHLKAFAQSLLPQTARYLVAAWEYRARQASDPKLTAEEFARKNDLHAYALRQWADYLAVGDYVLMQTYLRDFNGFGGLDVWRNTAENPSMTVNLSGQAYTIGTATFPSNSLAVHPGPTNGVVIAWKSPVSGFLKVIGRVTSLDPNGGNGIAWILDKRTVGGAQELASGEIPRGGKQSFEQGKDAKNLNSISIKKGEMLQLLILPKDDYSFDSTQVEMVVMERDGGYFWNLTSDVITHLRKHKGDPGNPFADRQGNPKVWFVYDMADSRRVTKPGESASPALAAWERAVQEAEQDAFLSARTRARIEKAAQAFQQTFTLTDNRSPFWIRRPEDRKALPAEAIAELERLDAELEALKKSAPPPLQYANGAQEGGVPGTAHAGIRDARIHIRGRYDRLGDPVPRRFPIVLAGANQKPISQGSGRLELARWLASPTHPLTSRVMVNRVWLHHFGEGIVRTPSNFGALGERPTHPELLDWLAARFAEGIRETAKPANPGSPNTRTPERRNTQNSPPWSLKALHRLIMLSATYQQASEPPARTWKLDPDNRLFGWMNRRRLEAEAVRDNLLAVSGQLDTTAGGPSVQDFNTPRRTLYITTIRSDRSGFGPLFDAADPTGSVEKRVISTVAPQALYLLNHPFVTEQTKALAKRLLKEAPPDESARIGYAYRLLYGRPPTPEELRIGQAFLAQARRQPTPQPASDTKLDRDTIAWEAYAQILLCANEFVFVD